jgi:hypothetical protein
VPEVKNSSENNKDQLNESSFNQNGLQIDEVDEENQSSNSSAAQKEKIVDFVGSFASASVVGNRKEKELCRYLDDLDDS